MDTQLINELKENYFQFIDQLCIHGLIPFFEISITLYYTVFSRIFKSEVMIVRNFQKMIDLHLSFITQKNTPAIAGVPLC